MVSLLNGKVLIMKLEFVSDYNCPYCYLAELRIQAILNRLNASIELIHVSYQLDKHAPMNIELSFYEASSHKYDASIEDVKAMMAPLERLAKSENVVINFENIQATNTFLAHRFAKALEAKGHYPFIHKSLYEAYFEKGYNLSDHNDLFKVAQQFGINEHEFKEMILDQEALKAVLEDQKKIQLRSIQGIPQLFYRGKLLAKGLVESAEFEILIKKAYIQEMEK